MCDGRSASKNAAVRTALVDAGIPADRIAKLLDAAKAEIKATVLALVEGDMADVTVTLSERKTIDTKLAQQFLTADQIASCTKTSLVETLKVKAKVAC